MNIWDVPVAELRQSASLSTPERAFFGLCLRGDLEGVMAAAPALPQDALLYLVNGLSGFHVSCRKGHVDVVSYLLVHAQVPRSKSANGRTGLMLAAQEGRLEVVKLLAGLEHQADQRDDRGNSAIHWACSSGSLACVQHLLEAWPCEVALAKNAEGLSALQVASAGNFPDVVELLVAKLGDDSLGSSSDSGKTALHRAATHGAVDTIKLFLSKNRAAVDQAASNGQTAIHLACEHGFLAAVLLLSDAQADVNAKSAAGLTCLHYALIGGHEDVAMHLIRSAGADCLALAGSGASALHFAAAANLPRVCRVLFVEHGLDPCSLLDREGRSAVDAARGMGYKELADRLASWPALSRSPPLAKVLFCGTGHFESGFILTRRALLHDEGVWVLQCAREDVPHEMAGAHVVVPLMTRIMAELLAGAPQLRMVMQFGVGLEGVDVPAATKRGVRVCKIPSDSCGNAQSCAEHAVFLSLAVLRDLKGMARSVVTGRLGHPTGRTLLDASVLIVGYGGLGRELAARLVPFGTRRLYVAKRTALSDLEAAADPLVSRGLITVGMLADVLCPVKRFAAEASLVILCCTLTDETRGLVNRGFLHCFAPGVAIVNIARGGLIDHAALLEALESGHVSGAGLDVYHTEPFPLPEQDHLGLIAHPRVVATPHVAGVTDFSYQSMADIVADNVRRLVSGEAVTGAVN